MAVVVHVVCIEQNRLRIPEVAEKNEVQSEAK